MVAEEIPASVQDLEWAIHFKREEALELAEARLELALAQLELDAAVSAHNEMYREREAARAAARFERETAAKDADWEETADRLEAYADWLDFQMFQDLRYYRANDWVYRAEKAVRVARLSARYADRALYELLKQFREGLVIDESLQDPALNWDSDDYYDDCCCPMCRPYLYDCDDDYGYFYRDEDPWLAEERLELEEERRTQRTKKEKAYKRRVLRRGRNAS